MTRMDVEEDDDFLSAGRRAFRSSLVFCLIQRVLFPLRMPAVSASSSSQRLCAERLWHYET